MDKQNFHDIATTAARVATGTTFAILGAHNINLPADVTPAVKKAGIPHAWSIVQAHGAALIAGGIALAAGKGTAPVGYALAATMVPTTAVGHPYWKLEKHDPDYNVQRAHFWKNVAITGAAVSIAAGAGRASTRERSKGEKIAHAIEEKMAWFPWPEGLTA